MTPTAEERSDLVTALSDWIIEPGQGRRGATGDLPLQSRAINREMFPEDLVRAVLFLATEDSDFLTCQTINVAGGKYNY